MLTKLEVVEMEVDVYIIGVYDIFDSSLLIAHHSQEEFFPVFLVGRYFSVPRSISSRQFLILLHRFSILRLSLLQTSVTLGGAC